MGQTGLFGAGRLGTQALFALALCLTAASAGAAAVSFVQVQSEGSGNPVVGLNDVSGVAVSPDGNSLYTAGSSDNAIGVYSRSAQTGRLVFIQSLTQGDQPTGAPAPVAGLDTPVRVTVAPGGQAVYAIDAHGALAVFDRDASSGELTFRNALTSTGLAQARAVAVSPNGADLYVAGDDTSDNAAGTLVRISPGSPAMPPEVTGSALREGVNNVTGLATVADMAFSADGRYLYISSSTDNAVAVFARDTTTGALSFQQSVVNGQGPVSGLKAPGQLALSTDGRYLYVAAGGSNAVTVFQRDGSTGELSIVQTLAEGNQDALGNTVAGLGGAYAIARNPDGSQIYAAGETGNTLAVLNRNALSGRLTFADALTNNRNGVDGLDAVLDLAVSPDGQFLYTAATNESKVGVFSIAAADLNLALKANAQVANVGKQLQYIVTVTNKGGDSATGTTVYDRLPANLTFVKAESSQGQCNRTGGAVVCRLNTVVPGTTATVTVTGSVNSTDTLADTAQVTAEERDPQPGDNSDRITVMVNHPPVANDDRGSTNTGMATVIDVLANDTDPDKDPLAVSGYDATSAHGGTIAPGGNSGGLTYTPPPKYYGRDSFHYTVTDGRGGSATGSVVVAVNGLPDAVDDNAMTEPGAAVDINVLANDTDPDGDTLTLTSIDTASAKGGTVARGNGGEVTYTPASAFAGTDTFNYTVSDGHNGGDATAAVTVVVNTPPVAADDQVVTNVNTQVTIPVLNNDSDPDGQPLMIMSVGAPSKQGATVTINKTDGTLVYSPPRDTTGTDTFPYTIADSLGAEATATVSVLINTPPIAVDDSAETTADTPVTIYVLANDRDPDSDPFEITAVDSPTKAGGRTALNSDGTVTYTPPKSFTGGDSFGYTITDSHGASSSATVAVHVVADKVVPQSGSSGGVSSGGSDGSTAGGGGGGALSWLSLLAALALWSRRRSRRCVHSGLVSTPRGQGGAS